MTDLRLNSVVYVFPKFTIESVDVSGFLLNWIKIIQDSIDALSDNTAQIVGSSLVSGTNVGAS